MAEPESLCVYCRRQRIDPATRPFCSERCRMADLGRWLSGDYRVPVEGEGPGESQGEEQGSQPDADADRKRDN